MSYVWQRDLATILRAAGLTVVEHDGWKTRGRPTYLSFAPTGAMLHHDASAAGPSPTLANYIAVVGRPPGTPPPLSQLWVSKRGVWHVLAAGRANHAGTGSGWGNIKANTGNSATLGVEWDHTTGESVTQEEYNSLVTGFAAIFKARGWNVDKNLPGHKEYAAGRKIDPAGVDMSKFRAAVKARQKTLGRPSTPTMWEWNPEVVSNLAVIQQQFQIVQGMRDGKIARYHGVAAIQNALNVKAGENLPVNGIVDHATVAAWRRFETKSGKGTGSAGTPDPSSLKALQIAYRFTGPEATLPKPPAPEPPPVQKTRSFPVATSNVGTQVTTELFKTASAGVHLIGWQEVDSPSDWVKLNSAMQDYRNVGVSEQNPQHNTPISVADNWTVVDAGFRKLYDGENGISHTRHATWAEVTLDSDPTLRMLLVNVHWPSAAFGPSGNIRTEGDRIALRVSMWNEARDVTEELIKEKSQGGKLPVILTGDFNRQVIPAYTSADFGRKTQAFDHGLDWIYLIDGDNEQFTGGAEFLRSVGSDHKTFGKHVGVSWS